MPDAVVVMTLRGEELESLSFRRMVSTGEAPAAGETITAATALARFLEELNQEGYVCSQVREVYPGYSLSGSTAVRPTPGPGGLRWTALPVRYRQRITDKNAPGWFGRSGVFFWQSWELFGWRNV